MDALDLIRSFGSTYTVTRRPRAQMVRGRAVPGTTSTLTIDACVQQATGRDLLRLPEGRRSIETRVVYSATALLTGAQGGTNEADLVAIDGLSWEVQHVEPWPGKTGRDVEHWRCLVQLTVPPTGTTL